MLSVAVASIDGIKMAGEAVAVANGIKKAEEVVAALDGINNRLPRVVRKAQHIKHNKK